MNRTRKKGALATLIVVTVLLGFTAIPRVYAPVAYELVLDSYSVPQYTSVTGTATTNNTDATSIEFNWYDVDGTLRRTAIASLAEANMTCNAECTASDTFPSADLDEVGTWDVTASFYEGVILKALEPEEFTVTQVPAFPLGLLPLAAVVIAVAMFARRDRLASIRHWPP